MSDHNDYFDTEHPALGPREEDIAPYGWKPAPCGFCNGLGTESNGGKCMICDGTGLLDFPVSADEQIAILRAELEASQQRETELEAALENIGNMAYTALHWNGDIRDRNLAELEHACMLILAEVNDLEGEDSPTKEETR